MPTNCVKKNEILVQRKHLSTHQCSVCGKSVSVGTGGQHREHASKSCDCQGIDSLLGRKWVCSHGIHSQKTPNQCKFLVISTFTKQAFIRACSTNKNTEFGCARFAFKGDVLIVALAQAVLRWTPTIVKPGIFGVVLTKKNRMNKHFKKQRTMEDHGS